MIAKTMKIVTALAIAVAVLASCSSGNDLGMASQEAVAKVKELVKSQVPADAKVYRVEWREDRGDRKLENVLSEVSVFYITPDNNDYLLVLNRDGDFKADGPSESRGQTYAYEPTTALDLNAIDAATLQKWGEEGDKLLQAEEEGDQYELKSVENFTFYTLPVEQSRVERWNTDSSYKADSQKQYAYFSLNYTKKGEKSEMNGRLLTTNYYTVPFRVNESGQVEFE
ncbi:hypothetical protein [Barnesiella viscericola]|uniref:hypothetical protein n=2 Tax=Barnesiella viscericola TaxID=397865 RepID=UPI0023543969|nr:hypothetical protein [Barnesiella viscericola]